MCLVVSVDINFMCHNFVYLSWSVAQLPFALIRMIGSFDDYVNCRVSEVLNVELSYRVNVEGWRVVEGRAPRMCAC